MAGEPFSTGCVFSLTIGVCPSSLKNIIVFINCEVGKVDAYNSKTASRIVGVSLRQIQYWDERGFVRPSVKLAGGRGTKRLYSFHDLISLKVVKDLTDYGMSLDRVRRCLRPLREYAAASGRPADSLKYVTDGERLFMITDDRHKIMRAMERRFVLSFGFGSLVRELSGTVERVENGGRRKPSGDSQQLERKRIGSA
jgi:DNA-binding transcriptional MerR regulator